MNLEVVIIEEGVRLVCSIEGQHAHLDFTKETFEEQNLFRLKNDVTAFLDSVLQTAMAYSYQQGRAAKLDEIRSALEIKC